MILAWSFSTYPAKHIEQNLPSTRQPLYQAGGQLHASVFSAIEYIATLPTKRRCFHKAVFLLFGYNQGVILRLLHTHAHIRDHFETKSGKQESDADSALSCSQTESVLAHFSAMTIRKLKDVPCNSQSAVSTAYVQDSQVVPDHSGVAC